MVTVPISANFRKRASRAALSIVFFIAVYWLLFLLSIGVFTGCLYGAFLMGTLYPSLVTLGLGIGIAAAGVFVMYFMIKFMFTKNRSDYSGYTELDIESEPKLKKMISELVQEVGTEFPKKIYLTHEVNASVFYDSTFWSMFFPVKKNLHIGMGLVNSCTVSELKGILAHEFGHFSQRSMKVGSYVYNVNQVIHNILYDNEGYENAVRRFASTSNYFMLFIAIATHFNAGVQYVLRAMYKVVNVNYLALSREMEFHADAIAVHIAGTRPMVSSMLRLDLAAHAMSNVVSHYEQKVAHSISSKNVFPAHFAGLQFLGQNTKLEFIHGFPDVTLDYTARFDKSKLVINNQWESHPATADRIAAFEKWNISKEQSNLPANSLFKNLEALQEKVSKKLFEGVPYAEAPVYELLEDFKVNMYNEFESNQYPEVYNGYYDNYSPLPFELGQLAAIKSSDLFSDEIIEVIYFNNALKSDMQILKAVAEKLYDIKSFDYDGAKYEANKSAALLESLTPEATQNDTHITNNDKKIYSHFLAMAQSEADAARLNEFYERYFDVFGSHDEKMAFFDRMQEDFMFAYEVSQHDVIHRKLSKFTTTEKKFKKEFGNLLNDANYSEGITPELKADITEYINSNWLYFDGNEYNNKAIEDMNTMLFKYSELLSMAFIRSKKNLLDFQASLHT